MCEDNKDVFKEMKLILARRQVLITRLKETTDGDEYDSLHIKFQKSGEDLLYLASLVTDKKF